MKYLFKSTLSAEEFANVNAFYDTLENVTIEQHPKWSEVLNNEGKCHYYISSVNNQIKCFAVITHQSYSLFKTARISFGPLFSEPEYLIDSIKKIREEYKKNGFYYLSIQLAVPVSNSTEYIEYKLNQAFPIKYNFDRNNWTSLIVELSLPSEDTFKRFSKGHKSAIKKSITEGITVRKLNTPEEVKALSKIYVKMNIVRGLLNTGEENAASLFGRIFTFIENHDKGFFLGVYDQANTLVGGIIVIYQGNTARYYKGASDPDRKDIAILHLALFEAFKIAKEAKKSFFDLWGYNHMVDEKDQVFFINRFKKGFSDTYLFYPKTMHISLKKGGYQMFKKLTSLHSKVKFVFNLINKKRINKVKI